MTRKELEESITRKVIVISGDDNAKFHPQGYVRSILGVVHQYYGISNALIASYERELKELREFQEAIIQRDQGVTGA